jgi:hypothetical protein
MGGRASISNMWKLKYNEHVNLLDWQEEVLCWQFFRGVISSIWGGIHIVKIGEMIQGEELHIIN